ncbi:MAG: hypothetical protein CL569_19255 [Alphaproteobacteria bacterium]|nr:hypothetical protein [Alphaproteobacteria bacterium]|tara:strand:+ start:1804 stop:2340 length:537 start_codon:yes stop_codon:yes gene_type:complete
MSDVPDIEQQRVDARAAYLTGRFADAIEAQRCVVEFADQDPHAALTDHLRLALYLYGAGDHVGRLTALEQAERIFPDEPRVLENLGVTLLMLNRLDEARSKLKSAVTLGTDSFNVFDALALCWGRASDRDKARESGERSLNLKDAAAVASGAPFSVPTDAPTAFKPSDPDKNIIAFSL